MFPPPEILGYSINWFELITVLAILISLVFGRFYFYANKPAASFSAVIVPLGALLLVGYFATYFMAYLEGQAYGLVKQDPTYFVSLFAHKKFTGFVFLIFCLVLVNHLTSKKLFIVNLGDYLAVVVCFFIILEANACLFDGHGCYGRFTNLPWGMLFLHGSAPTILPVHPTPLYISISHLLLFVLLIYFRKRSILTNRLLLLFLIGTSFFNFVIEFFKNIDSLFLGLNFAQLVYGVIGLSSVMMLLRSTNTKSKKVN